MTGRVHLEERQQRTDRGNLYYPVSSLDLFPFSLPVCLFLVAVDVASSPSVRVEN